MAISILSNNTNTAIGYADPRNWEQQSMHERYIEEVRRQQYMAMQQQNYDPYRQMHPGGITDQQIQESRKPASMPKSEPAFLNNTKLLLLEK